MGKPFIIVDEQINFLERRGVFRTEGERSALMREGFYLIVNGYKQPFLEQIGNAGHTDDCHKAGATFDDLPALFVFDRSFQA